MKTIILAGPTASGKTALAVALARQINGEIISADSRQVYKYLDIGTAKPTEKEKQGIRHHLIDVVTPDVDFCVADFKRIAESIISEIKERGKVPIVAGGTGFYINSLLNGTWDEEDTSDSSYRNELKQIAETQGNKCLHEMLYEIDKISYEKIHPNNIYRVIRALEFYKVTGKRLSDENEKLRLSRNAGDMLILCIRRERGELYDRINARVDEMMNQGLLDEVQGLLEKYSPDLNALNTIGYKELIRFLKNETDLPTAIELIKQNTRHYAKRQMTWFTHQCEAQWIEGSNMLEQALEFTKDIDRKV